MRDRELVQRCNELARQFYATYGCRVPDGYRFDEAVHPQEQDTWNLASAAYYFIEGADVEEACGRLEDEDTDG